MYQHQKINEHLYKILDSREDAMYLIIGKNKALLIDSGMEKDNLSSYIKTFYQGDVILACSHGHIDHIGQSGTFNDVYMELEDKDVYIQHTNMEMGSFKSAGLCFKDIDRIKPMPTSFDLGNKRIDVYPLTGHTPGSVIFINETDQEIFTGDAIGSGCGCWMQLDECMPISIYHEALCHVLKILDDLQVDENWRFYGGHDGQEYQSKAFAYNPLNKDMVKDMILLCEKLLKNDIEYHETRLLSMTYKPYYVSYQKAEMMIVKEKVK